MEDIIDLAQSKKEREFVEKVKGISIDCISNIADTFTGFPFVGTIIKLGMLGNPYAEYKFVQKLSRFLDKDANIPKSEKDKFLSDLSSEDRQYMSEYILQYLLRAEDDRKADIMGFIYADCIYRNITNTMFLRLCSVIDRAFLIDLESLPEYVLETEESTIAANSFINLGLIDNYIGGTWKNSSTYELNEVGRNLYRILRNNHWFDKGVINQTSAF